MHDAIFCPTLKKILINNNRLPLNWKRTSSRFLSDEFFEFPQINFFLKDLWENFPVPSGTSIRFYQCFDSVLSSENNCGGVLFLLRCKLWLYWRKDFIVISFGWVFCKLFQISLFLRQIRVLMFLLSLNEILPVFWKKAQHFSK